LPSRSAIESGVRGAFAWGIEAFSLGMERVF
jgi:hypothetical protein